MRLFFAFELPAAIKNELTTLIGALSRIQPRGVKWVAPENLHITLQFLGDVSERDIREIDAFFIETIREYSPFGVRALQCDFVPAKNPRLIWTSFETQNKHIYSLPGKLAHFFDQLGYEIDRKPLKLHATLGRFSSPPLPGLISHALSYRLRENSGTIDEISLYKSTLLPQGPVYKPLYEYALFSQEEG